ncbi:MAG: hypothetical protein MUC77_04840 [Chromatiaceae bacterium]|nr:hypothetical protein [Chromatiaceae bacterium]
MVPVPELSYIAGELRRQAEEILAAFDDRGQPEDIDPRPLLEGLIDLLDRLHEEQTSESDASLGPADPAEARAVEGLSLPLACWIARRGGEISNLAPVVNAVAGLANGLREPNDLERLYPLVSEVVLAVSPQVAQDSLAIDPTRPWRVLLINRAIVATRSHQPALMEEAFAHLVEHLPQEAPEFFREGMEQMEARNYPGHVRLVMHRWHLRWGGQRTLH